LEEFARSGFEAVLVGGYAVAYHGRPRATKDIDLLLEGSEANLERAAGALARFGAPSHVVEAVRRQAPTEMSTWDTLLCASTCSARLTASTYASSSSEP
jgi:hypothetical protein